MSLKDAWQALWGGAPQAEARGLVSDAGGFSGLVGTGQASPRSRQQLLQAIGEVPALMAAQTRVSNDVARLKWSFYLAPRGGLGVDGLRSELAAMSSDGPAQARAIRGMTSGENPDLVPYTGALTELWRKPCPGLTANSFRWTVNSQQDLSGESVLWVRERDGKGRPTSLLPVPSYWLDASTDRVTVTWPGGRRETVEDPVRDILRYRRPHPANPWGTGLGVAEALNNELSTDEAAAQLTYARYSNGGMPTWIIGMPGAQPDEIKAMQTKWRNRFSGPRKAGGVFFGAGKVESEKLNESIADLSIDKQREFFRDLITMAYNVPPEILGISVGSASKATSAVAPTLMARGCTAPRASAMCDFVQEQIVPQFDDPERVLVVVENPIPEDKEFQLTAFKAAPHTVSRDQWNAVQGLAEADGPDVYYVPANLTPVEVGKELSLASKSGAEPKAPAKPKEPEPDPTGTDDDDASEEDTRARLALVPEMRAVDGRIQAIVDELQPERISKPLEGLWSRNLRTWMASELAAVGAAISFNLINPMLTRHLAELSGKRIKSINETTREQVRSVLTAGVREGEDIARLAKRVEGAFDVAASRATTIARTEVVRSSNWGTYQAHKMSGLVSQREWIATPDGRTRHAHTILDGQVVGINQPFVVPSGEYTGREADHPGGFGVAALDIACRCAQAAVIDDGRSIRARADDERRQLWEAYAKAISPWESQAESLVAVAFRAQKKLVLRKLHERFGHELAG